MRAPRRINGDIGEPVLAQGHGRGPATILRTGRQRECSQPAAKQQRTRYKQQCDPNNPRRHESLIPPG